MKVVWLLAAVAAVASVASAGCVSSAKYDDLEVAKARVVHQRDVLQRQLDDAHVAADKRDTKISELTTDAHNAHAQLDEVAQMSQAMRDQLSHVGADVDRVQSERGSIAKALEDARARLEVVERAQAAADARAAAFRDFSQRFATLIAAGQLTISVRAGRLTMTIPSDILFDAGRASIKTGGKGALLEIAKALSTFPLTATFQVGAHTDATPPSQPRVTSNWDLSAIRASEIVRLFIASGVRPGMLIAAGFADADPLTAAEKQVPHASDARVEITMRPSAEEMLIVPKL